MTRKPAAKKKIKPVKSAARLSSAQRSGKKRGVNT